MAGPGMMMGMPPVVIPQGVAMAGAVMNPGVQSVGSVPMHGHHEQQLPQFTTKHTQ